MTPDLGRLADWRVGSFGPQGAFADKGVRRIIITDAEMPDGVEWRHASISRKDKMPTYDDLVLLYEVAYPGGYAYQCFVPPSEHINIHPRALHLWGRADGSRALHDFTEGGTSI